MSEYNGANHVLTGSKLVVRTAAKTRPNNTNTYAAGDVIAEATSGSTVWTFPNVVRTPGGSGTIRKVAIDDSAAVAAIKLVGELWLFSASPTTDQDNEAFTPTDAEMLTREAIIPFTNIYVGDATAGAGGNVALMSNVLNTPFKCAQGSTSLFGILVARNAYVPVAQEIFTARLWIDQD